MQEDFETFFTQGNDPYTIMSSESQIAEFAGIPFTEVNGLIHPLTTINENILCEDAPRRIVQIADHID